MLSIMTSSDPLNFEDTKKYSDRLNATIDKTGIKDAVTTAYGKMNGIDITIACMNFNFIEGLWICSWRKNCTSYISFN